MKRVNKVMESIDVDCAVFFSLEEGKTNANATYILGEEIDGQFVLVTRRNECVVFSREDLKIKNCENVVLDNWKNFPKMLDEYTNKKEEKIGIDGKVSFNIIERVFGDVKEINVVNIHEKMLKIREVKDQEEVRRIKKACRLLENVFEYVEENKIYEMEQMDAWCALKKHFVEKGLKEAFEPIVSYDGNSSYIHGKFGVKNVKKVALFDVGVRYKGYCSDGTKTYVKDKESLKVKEDVLQAMWSVVDVVKGGESIGYACKIGKKELEKYGKKAYFNFHSLGHGVGVEVHEYPVLSEESKDTFKENMIISVEPGVYVKNKFGIRFETMIRVKKRKSEVLLNLNY